MPGRRWLAVLKRTGKEFLDDELPDRAAALSHYGVPAILPAPLLLVSVLGLVGTSATTQVLDNLQKLAPARPGTSCGPRSPSSGAAAAPAVCWPWWACWTPSGRRSDTSRRSSARPTRCTTSARAAGDPSHPAKGPPGPDRSLTSARTSAWRPVTGRRSAQPGRLLRRPTAGVVGFPAPRRCSGAVRGEWVGTPGRMRVVQRSSGGGRGRGQYVLWCRRRRGRPSGSTRSRLSGRARAVALRERTGGR